MAYAKFIMFEGTRILRIDINNCTTDGFENLLVESGEMIRKEPLHSILSLAAGGPDTPIFTNRDIFVKFLQDNGPYIKGSAVSGLDKLKSSMFLSVISRSGRELKLFDNEKKAKKWLVSL